jgi:hypothetical protein
LAVFCWNRINHPFLYNPQRSKTYNGQLHMIRTIW